MDEVTKRFDNRKEIKKSRRINAKIEKVWKEISNIEGLPTGMDGIEIFTDTSQGQNPNELRLITLDDGVKVKEHMTPDIANKEIRYEMHDINDSRTWFTGISLTSASGVTEVALKSNICGGINFGESFLDFASYMESFYDAFLDELKKKLE